MHFRILLCLIAAIITLHPVTAIRAQDNVITLPLSNYGYGDLSLKGMYGAAAAFIPFQSNWVVDDVIRVEATYIASPLLNRDRATLTVFANDMEVTSIRPVGDGEPHTLSFTVPSDRVRQDGILLRFQGYLRITDEECEETNNPGQWLTILRTSAVQISPTLDEASPTLENTLPDLVVRNVPTDAENVPVVFVLPQNPNTATLTVAAQVAARLGSTADADNLPFEVITNLTGLTDELRNSANLVVVGTPDTQPMLQELADSLPAPFSADGFTSAEGETVPAEHGVIQILNAPWNAARKILVVSASGEAGLRLAGDSFRHTPTFVTLQGEYKFVRELSANPADYTGAPWTTPTTTFAQLGDRMREIRGTGIVDEYYSFRRPAGWILDEGSTLTLDVSFSPVLRASESYVSAFINDVFIGTLRTGQGIAMQPVTFALPVAQLNETPTGERPQNLTLRLSVANYLAETRCEQTHPETAWTRISPNSYFTTPHVYLTLPDLQAFPYPFVSDAADAPTTTIIVPSEPTPDDLANGLSMAATLGRYATHGVNLALVTSADASQQTHGDSHLIVIGESARNPLVNDLSEGMVAVPDPAVYESLQNPQFGVLREGQSPWNAERVALLVYSASEAGVNEGVSALWKTVPPVSQPGSVAVVEDGKSPRIVYRANNTSPQRESAQVVREPVVPQPEPWLVVTGILLLATVTVVAIVVLSRRAAAK
jgi:hypothetical protein